MIGKQASEIFGAEFARQLRILYAGSVKASNVEALMAQEEATGMLVGRACLIPSR